MADEPLAFDELKVGMEIPQASFLVSADVVDAYRKAVQAPPADRADLAPASLAAVYVRAATVQLRPPPGGIVAGQRFRFHRPVRVGERLVTSGEVEELFVKKGNRFVVLRTDTVDEDGEPVTTGWGTRIWAR